MGSNGREESAASPPAALWPLGIHIYDIAFGWGLVLLTVFISWIWQNYWDLILVVIKRWWHPSPGWGFTPRLLALESVALEFPASQSRPQGEGRILANNRTNQAFGWLQFQMTH